MGLLLLIKPSVLSLFLCLSLPFSTSVARWCKFMLFFLLHGFLGLTIKLSRLLLGKLPPPPGVQYRLGGCEFKQFKQAFTLTVAMWPKGLPARPVSHTGKVEFSFFTSYVWWTADEQSLQFVLTMYFTPYHENSFQTDDNQAVSVFG